MQRHWGESGKTIGKTCKGKPLTKWKSERCSCWQKILKNIKRDASMLRLLNANTEKVDKVDLWFAPIKQVPLLSQEDELGFVSSRPADIVTVALTEGNRYVPLTSILLCVAQIHWMSQMWIFLMKSLMSQQNWIGNNLSRYVVGLYAICSKVYIYRT